jgi:hypothetical protein
VFDLRVLGALHLVLFLGGVGLLVAASRAVPWPARAAGAALLVLVFTDVGYLAPFNSFYTQTASLLFLLLTAGAACLAATRRGPVPFAAYFVFAALFVGSKPQESLHGPILAAFGVFVAVASGAGRREKAISWILAAALCGFSVWYFRSSAPEYRRLAKFNAVFLELVPSSPTPARDLQDLGMDPAWAAFALKPAYPEGLRLEALDELGYGRLLRFYLARPARFASLVRRAAPSAFELRPQALGNFEKSTGRPPRAKSDRFAVWSGLRSRLSPVAVVALLVLAGAAAASAAWPVRAASPSDRIARAGIVAVAAMAATELFVCILADALFGLPRHLYLFQALADLLLIGIVVRAIALWVSRPRRLAGARA